MVALSDADGSAPAPRRRSPRGQGRARLLDAATDLFAEQGVSATSLQAIADRLGVTKAAVYHQFSSKEAIVLAVAEPIIERLRSIADRAEALDEPASVAAVIEGLVDLVIDERGIAAVVRLDPAMVRTLDDHEPYRRQIARIDRLLLGPDPTVGRRIAFGFAGGGIMAAGSLAALDEVPTDVLRAELIDAMTRALNLDDGSAAS
ncbi:helix-turn-helix domain-containing protein [uncultured Plantibacter sp.]|uniref:TetR/AcrR family transcriptional regulator n=1 Tax=uncultured Plantibacter sp. TaxID=293337 RepID=UPI0028CFF499|nr:helix-turn-helix domain-containing protein [uncultured Plantibacter sp.]